MDKIDKKVFCCSLRNEICFYDEDYLKQLYLIDERQLNIPLSHDLNSKLAWINGFTGKNVGFLIFDDSLDHKQSKVNNFKIKFI